MRWRVALSAVVLAMVVTACSSGDDDQATSTTATITTRGSTTTTTGAASTASTGDLVLDPNHDYGDRYADGIVPVGDGRYRTDSATRGYV